MITIEKPDDIEIVDGVVAPGSLDAGDSSGDHESGSRSARRLAWMRDAAAAIGWAFVGFAVLGALWQLVAMRVPELPGPGDTMRELGGLLTTAPFAAKGLDGSPGIGLQLLGSLRRVFFGFGLAALVGVPLGFLIGGSRRAWRVAWLACAQRPLT